MRLVAGRGAVAKKLATPWRRAIGKMLLAGGADEACCWSGRRGEETRDAMAESHREEFANQGAPQWQRCCRMGRRVAGTLFSRSATYRRLSCRGPTVEATCKFYHLVALFGKNSRGVFASPAAPAINCHGGGALRRARRGTSRGASCIARRSVPRGASRSLRRRAPQGALYLGSKVFLKYIYIQGSIGKMALGILCGGTHIY